MEPSINDFEGSDFSGLREYEDWRRNAITKLEAERDALVLKYHELIMAVATKHPEETRHETALRYIQEAELSFCIESKSAQKEIEDGT